MRSQCDVSQQRCGGGSAEEQLRRVGVLLARAPETPRLLVVSRSLAQEVEGGGEDQLRVLDAGQVELEHVSAAQDSFERERKGTSLSFHINLIRLCLAFTDM